MGNVEAKQHWAVRVAGEENLQGVVVVSVGSETVILKDIPGPCGTPEVLKKGRRTVRLCDVEFVTLMKARS